MSAAGAGLGVAATGGGIAAGVIGQVHQHAAPRPPAAWPHQVGTLPPQAAHFQDRAESARLTAALAGGGTAVLGQAAGVLAGLGGVGKSQLAAHYARTAMRSREVDVLVWVTAAARAAVIDAYARAAAELFGSAAPEDPEHAAKAFLAWLEAKPGTPACRWLVVLDDLADPADLTGLWPPASPTGRTLVTTRRRDPALLSGRRLIPVDVFTPAEARAYLKGVLDPFGLAHPAEELDQLADDLGHLPLALAQAAAYIAELSDTGMTPAAYRHLLADRTTVLRDTAPDRLPDEQAVTVAATWSLSVEHADTLRPQGLARPMLHLVSFLDPNGIPDAVLTSGPARAHLGRQRPPARPGDGEAAGSEEQPPERVVTETEARAALSALRRLSLIEHSPDLPATAVRVHQLVQRAVRDSLASDQRQALARTTADALLSAWPEVERDTVLCAALRANTATLADCAGDSMYQPNAHAVLYRAAHSLGEIGQVVAARDHFAHITTSASHHLGPDHVDTLAARGNLARWRGEAGDAAGAATALTDLLTDMLRVLGPDHPHTFTTRNNLAHWLGAAGDPAGAATAYADLLTDTLRVLGPDHVDTLTARINLARWPGEAGDAAGAATAYADLLTDALRVLGPDHPHTLSTRDNLAHWLGEAGDAAGAATAYTDLLTDTLRVLGPDHPHTLTIRNNLAFRQGEAGDPTGAATAYADLLTDTLRVLGPDHVKTVVIRNNLAHWQGQARGDGAE
ncbi:tetratricopeptide repeat protein [Kitasatospora sp. SUK 42]|uniref:tetratricopeptide repeat protein n=1 Tax=Kitasatospora sp. SUK 42 TaxID=1588882 RepID=UPI0027E3AAAC|nr:tetratricopeptide repeat protein [Kitasatospora sp. SUK 42]